MDSTPHISLITAGKDKHYSTGLAAALLAAGVRFDFIGGDDMDVPELRGQPLVTFHNLRGDQSREAGFVQKMTRVLAYYWRIICYAVTAKPKIFHLLWNNKFEYFDRTVLMLFYRLLGKKVIFTAHNVNAGARDNCDSFLNRLTLKIQYRLCAHLFVHTNKMKAELVDDFGVAPERVSVIPLGFYSNVPNTSLTCAEAKAKLGLKPDEKAVLFFGNITGYKGLEFLVTAFIELAKRDTSYRLVIAGAPKHAPDYWAGIQQQIAASGVAERVRTDITYIADDMIEVYLKAGDVLVQPYTLIFQSGVLIMGMSFGIPIIASDVGSLKEDVIEGKTGFIFPPRDAKALEQTIEKFFNSKIYLNRDQARREIREHVLEANSWTKVARITAEVYSSLK